jgi:hypothetical protein
MNKHIKIYEGLGKFYFTVNKFSSRRHSHLTKHAERSYNYAWEAQQDARKIADDHSYHLKVLEKFALEDLSTPVVEDVAAERKLADHYEEIYDGLVDVASGMDEDDTTQKKVNYFESKAVVQEILFVIEKIPEDKLADEDEQAQSESRLQKIISKIRSLVKEHYLVELKQDEKESKEKEDAPAPPQGDMSDPMGGDPMGGDPMDPGGMGGDPMGGGDMGGGMAPPMASSNSFIKIAQASEVKDIDPDLVKEMLEEYGKRACRSLEGKHPGVTWRVNSYGVDLFDGRDAIIALDIGNDLFLTDVRPLGKIQEIFPYHSVKFYQAYWKPIVEGIGHCCVGDNSSVLHLGHKCFPDCPEDGSEHSETYDAINKDTKAPSAYSVSFRGTPASWFVNESTKSEKIPTTKHASAKYSKEDYYKNGKGAIVVCTEPELKSYYKQTGHVMQVVPFGEHLEVDINFGNHICRMVESQFDIIDGL